MLLQNLSNSVNKLNTPQNLRFKDVFPLKLLKGYGKKDLDSLAKGTKR